MSIESQLSDEEGENEVNLSVSPSADDILEVSPVNSLAAWGHSRPTTSATTRGGDPPTSSTSAPAGTAGTSAAVQQHTARRSAINEDAFSSSSESSSEGSSSDGDDSGDSLDEDEPTRGHFGVGDVLRTGQPASNRQGQQQPPVADQQQEQQQQQAPPQTRQARSRAEVAKRSQNIYNTTRAAAASSSSNQQHQQQQRPQKHGSSATSEFDKALNAGGYATSFFSADSNDALDVIPTISAAYSHPSTGGDATNAMTASGRQLSWDDSNTEVSGPTLARHVQNRQQQDKQPPPAAPATPKERKVHRVNITATTQSAAVGGSGGAPVAPSSTASVPQQQQRQNKSSDSQQLHRSSSFQPPSTSHSTVTADTSASVHGNRAGSSISRGNNNKDTASAKAASTTPNYSSQNLDSGVLPDVLMTMRQRIESAIMFDSDMMKLASPDSGPLIGGNLDYSGAARDSLKRSSQQSISASILVSLAHKRYERRRLAAMEIEKVVRSLVQQGELDRVRAILLLLSDDYVRSTSEDARKGGTVALAASAIGLKKANDQDPTVMECRDLILASVVHACQDHSQRVRYYATESLFNVVKVIPGLAVQHFFILFEILRSLYADVDVDVRSGAELLDKKLKEVIVGAMNSGSFSTDACVPVFARFVYIRNKATKRLTLTWLQELNEKLIGAPILEFLHLFLGGIFDMVADPSMAIRQSALAFLQSVLPKLLVVNSEAIEDMDDSGMKVDFDKILQSLVTQMEHPDPFVRKVAMYWMSRIVKAHMKELDSRSNTGTGKNTDSAHNMMNPDGRVSPGRDGGIALAGDPLAEDDKAAVAPPQFSAASISVRNSLPHVLPGILLSIGDTFSSRNGSAKDSFLPDQTTHSLAEQTNACLRDAVRRDGQAYVQHLDSFIVALREELDSPGGLSSRNPPSEERKLYRMDVNRDGTGVESPGWFHASDTKERNEESMVSSRLCALHWVIVLYESVVPDALKAEYAREFIIPIIHQLVDNPPERIVFKSLEVLAKITVPVPGEDRWRNQGQSPQSGTGSLSGFNTPHPSWASPVGRSDEEEEELTEFPMTDANVTFALDLLHPNRRKFKSRDREVFTALIQLHSHNQQLLADLSRVIAFMCNLQPPEFVFVSFAVELDRFVKRCSKRRAQQENAVQEANDNGPNENKQQPPFSSDLEFVSSFVQQMCHVLLTAEEAKPLRDTLCDCVGSMQTTNNNPKDLRRVRLFHILLQSFAHSVVATVSLCLWGGAYRTAATFLTRIDELDINLMFLLELDKLVEQLERPLFRHVHIRMLERNEDPAAEGSGAMLFKTLKFLLMVLPQSTCFSVLKDRLVGISRFRQSTCMTPTTIFSEPPTNRTVSDEKRINEQTDVFVNRVLEVRAMHCDAMWQTIRTESLETKVSTTPKLLHEEGTSRRQWLGYGSKDEEKQAQDKYRKGKLSQNRGEGFSIDEITHGYEGLGADTTANKKVEDTQDPPAQNAPKNEPGIRDEGEMKTEEGAWEEINDSEWQNYWANN